MLEMLGKPVVELWTIEDEKCPPLFASEKGELSRLREGNPESFLPNDDELREKFVSSGRRWK